MNTAAQKPVPPSLRVYLGGPITGLNYKGAVDWREGVAETLAETSPHIHCVSPMRLKKHLQDVEKLSAHAHASRHVLSSGHTVVARDLFDVDRCDIILLNLKGAEIVSIGTMVELGRASARGKFIIVIMGDDEFTSSDTPESAEIKSPHDHVFVTNLASVIVPDLDEAVRILEGF